MKMHSKGLQKKCAAVETSGWNAKESTCRITECALLYTPTGCMERPAEQLSGCHSLCVAVVRTRAFPLRCHGQLFHVSQEINRAGAWN